MSAMLGGPVSQVLWKASFPFYFICPWDLVAVSHVIEKLKDSERWGLSQYKNSRLGLTPFFRGPEDNRVCRLDKARKRDLASFLVLPSNPTPISQPRRRLERAGMGFL